MSFSDAYLAMVIAGFSAFAVTLFTVSIWTALPDRSRSGRQ